MKTRTLSQRLRRVATIGAGMVVAATIPGTASATITNSGHDLSTSGGSTGANQICIYCHTPHNADTSTTGAPLWNHELSTGQTYVMYSSGTMEMTTSGSPAGISKLCMSCHDGTVSIDSYGGQSGATSMSGNALIGTDLSDDHPISFFYDPAKIGTGAGDDAELHPITTSVTVGSGTTSQTGTIEDILLFGTAGAKTVECASCHDVHNTQISTEDFKMVRADMAGSVLCLMCHDK